MTKIMTVNEVITQGARMTEAHDEILQILESHNISLLHQIMLLDAMLFELRFRVLK